MELTTTKTAQFAVILSILFCIVVKAAAKNISMIFHSTNFSSHEHCLPPQPFSDKSLHPPYSTTAHAISVECLPHCYQIYIPIKTTIDSSVFLWKGDGNFALAFVCHSHRPPDHMQSQGAWIILHSCLFATALSAFSWSRTPGGKKR